MKGSRIIALAAGVVGVVLIAILATAAWLGDDEGTADPRPAPVLHYVALGDSFTAAPGVPAPVPAGGCHRSTGNYPALVARELRANYVDRSCIGASTAHLTASQVEGIPPQLDALTPETDVVTLGIGGNDGSLFGTLVLHCPALRSADPGGAPCRQAMRPDGRDVLFQAAATTRGLVVAAIEEIEARSPDAQVLVVGYPKVAPSRGTCPELPLAAGDYRYVDAVIRRLDRALSQAADRTDAEYVDVWRASRGHDVCSADPWVNGVTNDPGRATPYHPFAAEQRAVADLVLAKLR
ncbi:SGNH/GDSL hydrolase family protein [Nocardioides gansuensis]|nr:SGNH/GDSL hydrolase family protein [Nocardioides gansuensis]